MKPIILSDERTPPANPFTCHVNDVLPGHVYETESGRYVLAIRIPADDYIASNGTDKAFLSIPGYAAYPYVGCTYLAPIPNATVQVTLHD